MKVSSKSVSECQGSPQCIVLTERIDGLTLHLYVLDSMNEFRRRLQKSWPLR